MRKLLERFIVENKKSIYYELWTNINSVRNNITGFFCCKEKCKKEFPTTFRSSHQRCSMKKGVLRNLAKFTGKHLCRCLFFNKGAGLRPATLLKRRLWYRCFPVNFAKFLRTPILQNTSGRLLLYLQSWQTRPTKRVQ